MQLRRWCIAHRNIFLLAILLAVLFQGACSVLDSRPSIPQTKIAIYTAQPGETLSSIAARFEISAYDIFTSNTLADPRSLQPGDVLRIPFALDTPAEKLNGLKLAKHAVESESIERVRQDTSRRFVGKLLWPVASAKLGSPYGDRGWSTHKGIDLPSPTGTTVIAAHSGLVTYAGNGLGGYGNAIVINDGSLSTLYAHNSKLLVRIGEQIIRGQTIAKVGATGRATGPHLHFETRIRDPRDILVPVDPLVFYPMVTSQ